MSGELLFALGFMAGMPFGMMVIALLTVAGRNE